LAEGQAAGGDRGVAEPVTRVVAADWAASGRGRAGLPDEDADGWAAADDLVAAAAGVASRQRREGGMGGALPHS
jgi:hypothetical protein